MTATTIDPAQAEAFAGRAFSDATATMTVLMAAIGDKLGLFKSLASDGSATSVALAARTDTNERYVREWLGCLSSAGYLRYDPASGQFALPAEHVPVLAAENGPLFMGGIYQQTIALLPVVAAVIDAFRQGGGVAQAVYGEDLWEGMERFSAGIYEHLLVPVWLAALPDVVAKLEQGARVAGLSQAKLTELARAAGFGGVRRLPLDTPLNAVYELRL